MLLETYLKTYDYNIRQMHIATDIPETTLRNVNRRKIEKWSIEYFDALAVLLDKSRYEVIGELDKLEKEIISQRKSKFRGTFNLENRRYIGSKSKLTSWLSELMLKHTEGKSFFDVFTGTGVMTKTMLEYYDEFIINDFLYSNEIIYKAFFSKSDFDPRKLLLKTKEFKAIDPACIKGNYFSDNFGEKYFSFNDSKVIGEIRNRIEDDQDLNEREKAILIASLLYSTDKIANTVGHYDAYRKNVDVKDEFVFELIKPLDTSNKKIKIYREDSNKLVRKIKADIAFVDPPYNSRQYSRFYHVLENLVKWDKPKLKGVAMKPAEENMSDYCRASAPLVFNDLVKNLNCNYIVVTYNNTYKSKSSSSKNKITHAEILEALNLRGKTKVFAKQHQFFNTGKTDLKGHKEFVFITKVVNKDEQ